MVLEFLAAAIAMLLAMVPAAVVLCRDEVAGSVVAYEFITRVVRQLVGVYQDERDKWLLNRSAVARPSAASGVPRLFRRPGNSTLAGCTRPTSASTIGCPTGRSACWNSAAPSRGAARCSIP